MRHAKGFPLRVVPLVVISLLILTSCTTTATVATDTACQGLTPLSWSLSDTPMTIAGIKTHNEMWHALCNEGGLDRV